jgi:hypothetical protein
MYFNPDTQMFSGSMEIPAKVAPLAYASASFAPVQANGCEGMYEVVVYWPQKCYDVADKIFAKFKKSGMLSKNISVLDGGVATKVFLLPAGTGCVSIKKSSAIIAFDKSQGKNYGTIAVDDSLILTADNNENGTGTFYIKVLNGSPPPKKIIISENYS